MYVHIDKISLTNSSLNNHNCNKQKNNAAKNDTWRRIKAVITLYTI